MSLRVRSVAGLVGALGVLACAGKQDAAGMGQDCYRDTDCQSGLVCVANTGGNRVCSNDVKSLESMVDGPPPDEDAGAVVDDDAAAPMDPAPDADAGT